MKLKSLEDLYVAELKDLYSAETQLVKALPKMIKATSSSELQRGFEEHLEQTRRHVDRLDRAFQELETSPGRKKCKGMEALIEEGKEMLEQAVDPDVLDVALISAAQRIEHYEIAGYGTARAYARLLGYTAAVDLLSRTLDEEKLTDERLTQIAESRINIQATNGGQQAEMTETEAAPMHSERM
ncbi:MAG TPA: ferritin-like domain-containing protein [Anaerolineae bacterium]|nr:ferritin-like domain-containing protein [Anaerolineae bacterium]